MADAWEAGRREHRRGSRRTRARCVDPRAGALQQEPAVRDRGRAVRRPLRHGRLHVPGDGRGGAGRGPPVRGERGQRHRPGRGGGRGVPRGRRLPWAGSAGATSVALNITGGGQRRLRADKRPVALLPVRDPLPSKTCAGTGPARGLAAAAGGSGMSDIFDKCRTDGGYFGAFRARGDMYFTQPILEGTPGPRMKFQGREVIVWAHQQLPRHRRAGPSSPPRRPRPWRGTGPARPWAPGCSRATRRSTSSWRGASPPSAASPPPIVFNYGYLGVLGTVSALVGTRRHRGHRFPFPRLHDRCHGARLRGPALPALQAQRHGRPGAPPARRATGPQGRDPRHHRGRVRHEGQLRAASPRSAG